MPKTDATDVVNGVTIHDYYASRIIAGMMANPAHSGKLSRTVEIAHAAAATMVSMRPSEKEIDNA